MKQISKEQKSNLARLLATENLNIEHRKVKTAYFIPKTRTLCLPIWEDMSNDLYDLLCGHEVGHALYTPQDETVLKEAMKNIPHSYFNVVEDIRIDMNMKKKYPGLRKSYFNGYKELVERDFFGNIQEDANSMRFIDRLNIFTKSGNLEQTIEFNEQEQEFVNKSQKLVTFDDVIQLATEIFEYSKEENYDPENDPLQQEQAQNENGEEGEEETQSEESESNGEEENQQDNDEGDTTSSPDDKPATNEEAETQSKPSTGEKGSHNPDINAGVTKPTNVAQTDVAFEENKSALSNTDEKTKDNLYVTLPSIKSSVIIDYKEVSNKMSEYLSTTYSDKSYSYNIKDIAKRNTRFAEFKRKQMKTVHYMAKEFEMKKAADNYNKTQQAVSGSLNMNKLHSYKYNDDIFKKLQVEPGAKNHGMIMFIDWSGSMSDNLEDTINQTLNLVMFCKAVQIPFEVYAFSDINSKYFEPNSEMNDYWRSDRKSIQVAPFNHKPGDLFVENVTLINFLSSRMKPREYNEGMQNLFGIGECYGSHHRGRSYRSAFEPQSEEDYNVVQSPQCMRLGGTPLDPCIIAATTIVKEFITKNRIQKMNTIFLTDGCGHTLQNVVLNDGRVSNENSHKHNIVIRDNETKTNTTYDGYGFNSTHKPMLDLFKRKTGSKVIGFYISARNNVSYYDISNFLPVEAGNEGVEAVRQKMRKDKVGIITGNGYDELFILPKKNLKIVDEEANIEPSMTPAKMKQQFLKTLKTKKTSRVLLNKFVERVA
mgnify:FL=1